MQGDENDLEYFVACAFAAVTGSALMALAWWVFYEVWR